MKERLINLFGENNLEKMDHKLTNFKSIISTKAAFKENTTADKQ